MGNAGGRGTDPGGGGIDPGGGGNPGGIGGIPMRKSTSEDGLTVKSCRRHRRKSQKSSETDAAPVPGMPAIGGKPGGRGGGIDPRGGGTPIGGLGG